MADLPADREKALAAIAEGYGRAATRAHPLCICGQPTPQVTELPPCTRCGAEVNERCRQPGEVCGKGSYTRYRRRVREARPDVFCPVHQ